MSRRFLKLIICLTPVWLVISGFSQEKGDMDVESIIRQIDKLYRSESSYSEFEMEIVTPHWQRTMSMDAWTIGLDKTFIRINEPKKDKGVATLRIENEMWNYLPKTNKVMKIPPSMMMSSWMGSDFTNDDLVKEFSLYEDYKYELIEIDEGYDNRIYVNCIPREDLPVVWGNIVIAATKEKYTPIWMKYYDEDGKLMRVCNYSDVRNFGGRLIPAVMEMIPRTKEGHKTVIRYIKLEFDVKIDEDIFSLRNLRANK
ncbi:MAG: outer membrane lipoprotein-sorting protein [Candidatus Zixiibacteriota bacterium]|nr:MAG: outer membrane lipoprotein-sorting protein [candidate division Zixibacteria bacterium]HDL03872.1 outer membrane lipoprotein-sorting protein [candidate division Zixibacteria bacterium]